MTQCSDLNALSDALWKWGRHETDVMAVCAYLECICGALGGCMSLPQSRIYKLF